jgi:hypothetical protein
VLPSINDIEEKFNSLHSVTPKVNLSANLSIYIVQDGMIKFEVKVYVGHLRLFNCC